MALVTIIEPEPVRAESVSSIPDDAFFVRPRLARRVAHTQAAGHATSKHRKGAGIENGARLRDGRNSAGSPERFVVRVTAVPPMSPTPGLG
jgi:hypothetical protein